MGSVLLAGVAAVPAQADSLDGNPATDLVVLLQPLSKRERPVDAVIIGSSGTEGARQRIAGPPAALADVSANRRGDAVAYWLDTTGGVEYTNGTEGTVVASYRPAGGSFGPAVPLSDKGVVDELDAAVNKRGDAVVIWASGGLASSSWRPAGGDFQTPQRMPRQGSVGLSDSGEALLLTTYHQGDVSGIGIAESQDGGPWSDAHPIATVGRLQQFALNPLAIEVSGETALAAWSDTTGRGGDRTVLARRDGHGEWIREAAPSITGVDFEGIALGPSGDAALHFDRPGSLLETVRPQGGTWTAPRPIGPAPLAGVGAAFDERGDLAVRWTADRSRHEYAAYRAATGSVTTTKLFPHRRLTNVETYGPPAIGDGRAVTFAGVGDGDHVRTLLRSFGPGGAGSVQRLSTAPQWTRQGPASRCRPRGSTTLVADHEARVFETRPDSDGFYGFFGCAYARGERVELGGIGAVEPTAATLAGPYAAFERGECNDDPDALCVEWLDLRDEVDGVEEEWRLAGGEDAAMIVAHRSGAVAWTECRPDCAARDRVVWVRRARVGDYRVVRVAGGRGIDPLSLRLRGRHLSWKGGGRRHGTRLR
jgi:hypothetical protein